MFSQIFIERPKFAIVISLVITLLKVAIYAAVILLIKWLAGKLGGRKK